MRENIALCSQAMRQRLGPEPAGFRAPGGFRDGLRDRPDPCEMLPGLGFRWISSQYPAHAITKPGEAPAAAVLESIVAAQAQAQPFRYPDGLVEIPMSPISDVTAWLQKGRHRDTDSPEKYRHLAPAANGTVSDRLVSFVDFGPTVLHLASLPVPAHMHGRPFLGKDAPETNRFVHGTRDRMDETLETTRWISDGRYHLVRSFDTRPPADQQTLLSCYNSNGELCREIRAQKAAGALNTTQKHLWGDSRPPVMLFDTQTDSWCLNNLANDAAHSEHATRLLTELDSRNEYAATRAARSLELLGEKARPKLAAMRSALQRRTSGFFGKEGPDPVNYGLEFSLTMALKAFEKM